MKALTRVYEVTLNTGSEEYTNYELDVFGFFNDIRGDFVFDKTRIKNLSEKSLLDSELTCKQILPLVSNIGLLYITNRRVYFQPYQTIAANPVNSYNIKDIRKIFKRRYMLMRKGLEFWTEEETVYLAFKSSAERDLVYDKLMEYVEDAETEESLMHYTEQWTRGEMSNYDYLLKLNYHSYRSRSDLTQYPVFPWVIQDYDSVALDLSNPESFRDLSKPMGAINPDRLEEYKRRYNDIPEGEKYLYGTHYSAPGYVIGYLFRRHPRWMIKFQGGHFDNPNRLFKGIALEYESCLTNPGNVKELIPEFYEPEFEDFLINSKALDLGIRANGERVDDVILPRWADSPRDFLEKQRQALESDYVSDKLHLWIDLIFGRKQRSIEDNNIFHPLTYEGAVDLELISDPFERFATEQQINEFGQTPRQLFRYDHPPKFSTKQIVKSLFISADEVMGKTKLPTKINLNGEEEKFDSQLIQKEVGITDFDFSTRRETNNSSVLEEEKEEFKVTQEEEKKIDNFAIEHDQDEDMTNSFLKYIKYKSQESLGKVHNESIIEVNAYTDKSGDTSLMIVSRDGLIKLFQEQKIKGDIVGTYEQKRSFLVSEREIVCSCILNKQESVVVGAGDNNIILFNFSTGTEIGNFYTHDNEITNISVIGSHLLSFSADTTLKIWNMMNSDFANPQVFYDHEGSIISADVCKNSIISIDENGIILIRDITNPANIEERIEVKLKDGNELDHAIIKFNKADPFTFFVVYEDAFFVYEKSGTIINEISIDGDLGIEQVFQHKD